jgi:hypothetical protein
METFRPKSSFIKSVPEGVVVVVAASARVEGGRRPARGHAHAKEGSAWLRNQDDRPILVVAVQ